MTAATLTTALGPADVALHRLRWWLLSLLLLALGLLPLWLPLPEPQGGLTVTQATHRPPGTPLSGTVALPHRWYGFVAIEGEVGEYEVAFDLPAAPATEPLYLYVPLLSQNVSVWLQDHELFNTETRSQQLGLSSGITMMTQLPESQLRAGRNVLLLRLKTRGVMPGYLSQVHVGTLQQMATPYRSRVFVFEHLRLMALACQLLLATAVLVIWLYRPREPFFGWLAALLTISLLAYSGQFADFHPPLATALPWTYILGTAASFMPLMLLLIINGTPVPRWLQLMPMLVPGIPVLLAAIGMAPPQVLAVWVSAPLNIVGMLSALAAAGWIALVRRRSEAYLLLIPLLMSVGAVVHDLLSVAGVIDDPIQVLIYYRPLELLGLTILLMRRFGQSLRSLDRANIHLREQLEQREAELSQLHAEERQQAARQVRGEERRRLTVDLHDGLSGHLASIIALAERERVEGIERTARDALDDLRVVIHSLSVGDRELGLALATYRDRLASQLKRVGIALDWSHVRLPDVSNVTPTQALNVLRILQEAITNARKHGPATHITVRGEAGAGGGALLTVENDGEPFAQSDDVVGVGAGLVNMRRRAAQLGGSLTVEPLTAGTRVTLRLPTRLPDLPGGTDERQEKRL
ncbi:sensor histidine kinase [Xenophilus azovorans]|uniref:sensor histidine kinase n=1 Tax=Xenophilus azovorans TaxID=151755 RepID=UPI000691E16B|nr:ATP-binding protein [Xenophilus azovorans]